MNEEDYVMYIIRDNIIDKLEDISCKCLLLDLNELDLIKLNECKITSGMINKYININNIMNCIMCNDNMIYLSNGVELCCQSCGYLIYIKGSHNEESNEIVSKPNPYQPSQHYVKWLLRILGQEKTPIPNIIIDKIKENMLRDSVKPQKLTCELIRSYLKHIYINGKSATTFNSNVVKILGKITGVYPPQPTAEEFNKLCYYFELADEIYTTRIRQNTTTSRTYYPFLASKTISIVYANNPKIKQKIIKNIHKQDEATHNQHEIVWKEIIKHSNGLLY
jgi:hypothetical protein